MHGYSRSTETHCFLEDRFTSLEVGATVQFAEVAGEKGPQASAVRAGR